MESRVYYTTEIGRMRMAETRHRAEAYRASHRARESRVASPQRQVFYRRALAVAAAVWRWR